MLPISSVFASLLNLQLTLTFLLPKKLIFKLNLVVRLGLVCTIFFANNLLQLRNHSSKNYSFIFLPVFTIISSITLPTNTPRMINQSILSTHQILHFIPTIQPTFLKNFYIFLFFMRLQKFYHNDGHKT